MKFYFTAKLLKDNDTIREMTMREHSLFQRLLNNAKAGMVATACVFLIALLLGACAGGNNKQMSPMANADEMNQASGTAEADDGLTAEEKEIVCRMKATTGTRFKRRICATKAQWARLEEKNQAKTDEFNREVRKGEGADALGGSDAMGGQSMGAPR